MTDKVEIELKSIKKEYENKLTEMQKRAIDYAISCVRNSANQDTLRLGVDTICHSITVRNRLGIRVAEITTDENGKVLHNEKKGYRVIFENHYQCANLD